jgi:glycosyltransferase involved in cell wall biosynthesis
VWATGLLGPNTGIGVMQRALYPLLAEHLDLAVGPQRGAAAGPAMSTLAGRARSALRFAAQLTAPVGRDYSAALVMGSPRPLLVRAPYVVVVHDLRWARTRSAAARVYRSNELQLSVRYAAAVIAVSERTRHDLVELVPAAADKITVIHHGPGQVADDAFTDGDPGTVMLMGGSPHKRNHLAIEALGVIRPSWARRIIGVGLAPDVRESAVGVFGNACEWYENAPQSTIQSLLKRTETFIGLSTDEGFGIPFIEALASGCQVVAIDQPVTREVLGSAGRLLTDGSVEQIAAQLADERPWPDRPTREARAASYSWRRVADEVQALLEQVAVSPPR